MVLGENIISDQKEVGRIIRDNERITYSKIEEESDLDEEGVRKAIMALMDNGAVDYDKEYGCWEYYVIEEEFERVLEV